MLKRDKTSNYILYNKYIKYKKHLYHGPERAGLLSDEPIGDLNQASMMCPFGEFVINEEFIPALQPRENNNIAHTVTQTHIPQQPIYSQTQSQPHTMAPLMSYHDFLQIAFLFEQWYLAFLILQPLMGLRRLELPEALKNNISIQETDVLAT